MDIKITINEVSATDVSQIMHCTKRTAQRRISLLRDAYGLPKYAVITLDMFCDYYCIRQQDIHVCYSSKFHNSDKRKQKQR